MPTTTRKQLWLMMLPLLTLGGCGSDDDDDNDSGTAPTTGEAMTLNILHINDHHSHLEPDDQTLTIAGQATEFASGGFPRVAAKINERAQALDNVLKLHAGDAITGTLYFTSFEGKADAELMNLVCFDAFALGNHEFDRGDEGLKLFLDELNQGSCNTPVLAANVKPAVGTPLAPQTATDYIQPYVIKEVDGQQVGIIGIDIANKTKSSSSPLATTEFLDEKATAQATIDELQQQGVNKIVVLSHYQYANEVNLAQSLRGVDVIVGGDSHTLLGDFSSYGLTSAGDYPTQVTNADGDTACVVQAWQYSQIVGELKIDFDADGKVTACSGTPHLLLGTPIVRENEAEEEYTPTGDELAAIQAAIDAAPQLSLVTPDASVQAKLDTYTAQLDDFRNEVIGTATENLCLERIPGQGRSTLPDCPASSTAQRGGDIANLVAQAFLYQSKEADVAIQNAGGVRVDVPAGNITIGDAYTVLPFANTLVNLTMTGAEIRTVLNEAVDFAHNPNGSSGAYPYAAGLRWKVDMNRAAGSRLYDIEVNPRGAGEWRALQDTDSLQVVSNSFTAAGRDGYVTFGSVSNDGRVVDTYLDYAQSFVDYVRTKGTLSKPAADEYSTQSFMPAAQ
ncbi:NAD 5'-nucleotidase [Bacterioplanes sanyensis]|uniref:NAD nucleotidase n=1 Tax=Bacterioplanes sanyensis TaxID=1249553 RepID=UPI0016783BF1|nr:NAD nucleotidase [Bacterioplanes sanyensis]GGY51389.1 NAD 5'-nucleotidase [Bacterioplanes sanyensis]